MKRCLTALVLIFAFAGQSWADFDKGSQVVVLNLGAALPLSNLDLSVTNSETDKIGTTGLSVGGEYFYYIHAMLAFGFGGNYNQFGTNDSTKFSPSLNSSVNVKSSVFLALIKCPLLPDAKVIPYLLGGVGFHRSSLTFDATPVSGGAGWPVTGTYESRTLVSDSGINYAFAAGGGVDIPINDHIFVGAEARLQVLGGLTYNATAQGQAYGISSVTGTGNMVNLFAQAGYKF